MKLMKSSLLAAALTCALIPAAMAADEHNTAPGLTLSGKPLALHGSDPVALLDIGNRLDGSPNFAGEHDGVAYYFSSQANLDAFKASPERYTPEFGGFCAFGASVGKKFDGNPKYAAIEDGKLYVFLNEAVLREFHKDKAGTLAKARKNWKDIRHTAAASL